MGHTTYYGQSNRQLMLYVVPTPVGNLEDMTLRAIRILKEVEVILAEDTRVSRRLMDHYEISTHMRPYHAHNEHRAVESLVEELRMGKDLAIISDAGTPGISDAGYLLIRACHAAGVPVTCLPGPSALIPALVHSGLPCDRFHFEGFLPHKKGRQTRIKWLAEHPFTFAIYESPHRLVKVLKELAEFCGVDRQATVCREISKLHEESRPGTLAELIEYYGAQEKVKGEIVVVVAGKT